MDCENLALIYGVKVDYHLPLAFSYGLKIVNHSPNMHFSPLRTCFRMY